MSDIGDAFKYLYREFILRDLLSFVTPGAIIVLSILLLKWDFPLIINYFKSIPFLLYIPIFGVLFVVGFAIQCFGEIVGIIKFHHCKTDKEYFEGLVKFWRKAEEKEKHQHERFVVLQQMCGNSALAISIASAIHGINLWKPYCYLWAIVPITVLAIISLYIGHKKHRSRLEIWQNIVLQ